MNILRLSTISLTLVIAVMTLGVSTGIPSVAEAGGPPACKGTNKNDPDCSGAGGTETKYTVELQAHVMGGLVTTDACVGLNKSSKLHAVFPGDFIANPTRTGCAEFTISGGTYDGVTLHLGEIAVTKQNTRVILFFTSDPTHQFPGNETGFQTPRLVATPASFLGIITLTVNNGVVPVTKSNQPDKGENVGDIAVGAFVYVPVPSD